VRYRRGAGRGVGPSPHTSAAIPPFPDSAALGLVVWAGRAGGAVVRGFEGRKWALAGAVALAVHGLLFTVLVASIPRAPEGASPPVTLIDLYPMDRPRPPARAIRPPRPASAPSDRSAHPATVTADRGPDIHLPPQPPPATAPALDPGVGAALRASVGCASAGFLSLSPAQRRDCDRLARAQGLAFTQSGAQSRFAVDASKRAVFDAAHKRDAFWQSPFLSEKPVKGCKPTVTEHEVAGVGGGGHAHDWTAGVGCVVRF
jgi:hypothetical protein